MLFKKGYIPWSKGLTKETDSRLKKTSEALKGRKLSEEAKRKLSEAKKGHSVSEETRRKMSLAKSGKNHPMYGKTGENCTSYGRYPSEETRRKMSDAMKGHVFSEEHNKKISEAMSGENNPMYGKHLSEETCKNLSEINSGENHPQWLGGRSFEPYGVEFNDELKEQIRERDNHQCQLCGVYQEELSRSLDVHHIDYNKENNDPQNLVSLHDSCHAKTNVNRGEWKAYFERATAPRSIPTLSWG